MAKVTENQDIDKDQKSTTQAEEQLDDQQASSSQNKDENISDDSDSVKDEDQSTAEKEAPQELSPEEKLQKEIEQQKDKYVRLFAEFENFKRRTSKERMELYKTAGQEVMQSLLPVLDDFERALKEVKKSEDDELIKGIELISNKLTETLKSKGLSLMNVNSGDVFDADIHEAITQIPAPSDELKGKIVDVVEKGYTLGDKIIRYPKVVTGK